MIERWGRSIWEESTWVLKDLERGGRSRSGAARFNGGVWAEERERDFMKEKTNAFERASALLLKGQNQRRG